MGKLPNFATVKADDVIATLIYEAYEKAERTGGNERIGAAELGKECDRAIWYSFRWVSKKKTSGRILRLWETGHREEERVIENLRRIGCTVIDKDPETGKQWKVSVGRLVVKPDGKIYGVPQAPKTPHVLEVKTHSEKSFKALQKDGVRKSKPEHFVQTQIEMHWFGFTRGLYFAVNKNTDELYCERIDYDKAFCESAISRAERIASLNTPPSRIRDDPGFFVCKMCDHHTVCHMEGVAQVTCRSCLHADSRENGRWDCKKWSVVLDYNAQRAGCESHLFLPSLVPNSIVVDASEAENWVEYESDGVRWKQGEGYVSSREMEA